ncbi:TPA: DUF2523 domain-containing protein [Vibrio parahaemolyticus]|nr:DUF2523 domain-containing protein [Vibrio parahaemolyticus]
MPYLITFFSTVLIPLIPSIMRSIATYFAISIGFGLVAYTGVNEFLDMLADYLQANMSGVPSTVAQLLALAELDTCINEILSCLVFSFTLNGLMGATGYRPSWRKPTSPV